MALSGGILPAYFSGLAGIGSRDDTVFRYYPKKSPFVASLGRENLCDQRAGRVWASRLRHGMVFQRWLDCSVVVSYTQCAVVADHLAGLARHKEGRSRAA